MAGTGVGKSTIMCHIAANALSSGYSVLYITMEMAEEKISERIDANLLDIPIEEIENLSKSIFADRIHRLKKKTAGKLIVKEYPTGHANSNHFRALLNELRLKKEFIPDLIIIDYLNICASSRIKGMGGSINSYSFIKSIAEEIRGLAVEFDVPVISATQTNREGYSNSDPGLENTSECIYVNEEVTLKNGIIKKIVDCKVGDQIKANDGFKTIIKTHHIKKKNCIKIKLKSGKEIIVSKEHVFPSNRGRISFKDGLSIGDKLNSI